MFHRISEFSFIHCSIRIFFYSLTSLFILYPIPFVYSAITVCIYSIPMTFIIEPIPYVNVTILMNQSTNAACFIILPETFIHRSIWPYLFSFSPFHSIFPLTNVNCSIHKTMRFKKGKFFILLCDLKINWSLVWILCVNVIIVTKWT